MARVSFKDEINLKAKELMNSDLDLESYGCKSDTLFFKNALIDNLASVKPKPKVIGFAVVSSLDISIPVIKFKRNPVDRYDVMSAVSGYREVKAGEEFYVNYIELALLLSNPDYNCIMTGGDITAMLRVTASTGKNARPIPQIRLFDLKTKKDLSLEPYIRNIVNDKCVVEDIFEDAFGDFIRDTHVRCKRKSNTDTKKLQRVAKRAAMSELLISYYLTDTTSDN